MRPAIDGAHTMSETFTLEDLKAQVVSRSEDLRRTPDALLLTNGWTTSPHLQRGLQRGAVRFVAGNRKGAQ